MGFVCVNNKRCGKNRRSTGKSRNYVTSCLDILLLMKYKNKLTCSFIQSHEINIVEKKTPICEANQNFCGKINWTIRKKTCIVKSCSWQHWFWYSTKSCVHTFISTQINATASLLQQGSCNTINLKFSSIKYDMALEFMHTCIHTLEFCCWAFLGTCCWKWLQCINPSWTFHQYPSNPISSEQIV